MTATACLSRQMSRAALGAVLAGLSLAPVAAHEGPTAAFVELVRANGCTITEAEGETLLPAAGLSMDDAQTAVAILNRGALFTLSDDAETLILIPALCEADAEATAAMLRAAHAAGPNLQALSLPERVDPEQGARLVALIRAEGCAMTEDDADRLLPGQGFTPEAVQDIAEVMLNAGLADFDGPAFVLSDALCAADPAEDADRLAQALAAVPDANKSHRPAAPGRAVAPRPAQ